MQPVEFRTVVVTERDRRTRLATASSAESAMANINFISDTEH
jgi:hypothetical protein